MDLLGFLFPKKCIGCGELGSYLCPDCINTFSPLFNLYCPACRRPSLYGHTHPRCKVHCSLDGLISCYAYAGLMPKIVTKFKYVFVKDLADTLTELILSKADHPQLFLHSWTIVPIPLHISRKKWRGFNQAEVIAERLALGWGWEYQNRLLVRHKKTNPQMKLTGAIRRQNLSQAFSVTAKHVPKQILLIDDVATTCSTLNECAKVLRRAGAKEVWGLTLAQSIPR